ncbi:MAG: glycosyltransferase family 4 protein [Deltaproteobacteria bacterium]|nr:glycosyltransferase family 4 protein [Deltaproteobacteria bacterium]
MPTFAIDCRYITGRPSGIGSYVQGLVDWLPDLAPDLEFLLLRAPTAPAPLSNRPNVREQVVRAVSSGPTTMWALPMVVDLRGVDVFHAPFNIHPAWLEMPVITTVHDTMWVQTPELCRRPGPWGHIESFYWGHGLRRALRDSALLLTVSEASRQAIGTFDPAAAARTRVTPLGVDPTLRPMRGPEDEAILAKLRRDRLAGVGTYVLSVGQFSGYKNHEGVLRAFARAFRDRPDVHLVMVHRLGSSSRLIPLMKQLGIGSRVLFLHGLSDDELRALFWGAASLCHPSWIEGFGLPVAEAMACGCPVITSDVSAMPEVAGGAALLVHPADESSIVAALRRVVDDPALREDLRARGLRRAASFQRRTTAERTLAAYRELV